MVTLEEQFSTQVSAFLGSTGVRPTALGMKAVGDPNLMRQIERGRSPSLRTADRVLAYIAGYKLDSGGARAPPRRPGTPGRPRPATRARSTKRSRAMSERRRDRRTKPGTRSPAHIGGRGPDGPVAEHDLRMVGRRPLPAAGPAERPRGALGRGRGRGVDDRPGRAEPGRRGRPGGQRDRATRRRRMRTLHSAVWAALLAQARARGL